MTLHWSTWLHNETWIWKSQEKGQEWKKIFDDSCTGYVFQMKGDSKTIATYNHQSSLAIQADLLDYAKEKTQHNPALIRDKPGRPFLDFALNCEKVSVHANPEMAAYLLACGASSNQAFGPDQMTPWEYALSLLGCTPFRKWLARFGGRVDEVDKLLLKWVRIYTILVQTEQTPMHTFGVQLPGQAVAGETTALHFKY